MGLQPLKREVRPFAGRDLPAGRADLDLPCVRAAAHVPNDDTVAYPAPNPLPSNGARTNVQTLQGSVLDGQGAGAVQNNVLGAFSGNGLGSTIGASGNPDFHTVHAADDAIGHLLDEQLDTYCKNPAAPVRPALPAPTGFCAWVT